MWPRFMTYDVDSRWCGCCDRHVESRACVIICIMYIIIVTHIHTCIHTYITLYTLHCITLHYITLHYIALHYITLHCITLHYITSIHIHNMCACLNVSCISTDALQYLVHFDGTNLSAEDHQKGGFVWWMGISRQGRSDHPEDSGYPLVN